LKDEEAEENWEMAERQTTRSKNVFACTLDRSVWTYESKNDYRKRKAE